MTIYLLRHGKVDGPAALYGQTDIAAKIEQDQHILQHLLQASSLFDRVISSPLQRCNNVAQSFAKKCELPIEIAPSLAEMNFGKLDGFPFDQMIDKNKKSYWALLERFWQNPADELLPDAESLTAFHQRVTKYWQQIISQDSNENLLIICHGGVIRMIVAEILKLDWRNPALFSQLNIANASMTCIELHSESQISQINGLSLPISALSLPNREI